MTPGENLRQAKAVFDQHVDALFATLHDDQADFQARRNDFVRVLAAYSAALEGQAESVSEELAEAYRRARQELTGYRLFLKLLQESLQRRRRQR